MANKNKSNIDYKKPQDSTQANCPVCDVIDGIIITNESNGNKVDPNRHRYVKMIEVLPQPFTLKKNREQNKISNGFESLLKAGPDEMHIKSLSIPVDLTYQINKAKNCADNEKNISCKKMDYEYLNHLNSIQESGVTRRFFISFPYQGSKKTTFKSVGLKDIVSSLNITANRIASALSACGNEVVVHDDENESLLKTFYTIYNRDSFLKDTFEDRVKDVYEAYANKLGDKDFFVPVQDYICPSRISYLSSKYLLVNDTYYSFLYIPSYGYSPYVVAGWLKQFVDIPGVDVDVFLKRIPKEQVTSGLKRSIASSKLGAYESNDVSDAYEDSLNRLGSARYLKDGLSMGNDFYYMSTFLTISVKKTYDDNGNDISLDRMDFLIDEITKSARADDIVLKENKYRCAEMFNIVFPSSQWNENLYSFKKTKRNVLTEGAAASYLFATDQLLDKEGLYVADDIQGSPVLLDQFNRKRITSQHIAVFAETGSGKSVSLMLLGLRARVTSSYKYQGPNDKARKISKVIYLIPEKQDEYRRLTQAVGGTFIDYSSSSKHRLNPMAIYKVDEKTREKLSELDGDDEYENTSYLNRKISFLIDFFQLSMQKLSDVDKFELEDAIIRTYAKKGITTDNNSLWADEKHTHYKTMPIISDLVAELETKVETANMAKSVKLLTRGNGAMFDGQTNVDINNEFIVIGLQHNSSDMMGLASFTAMDFVSNVVQEDRTQSKYLFLDEFWKFANNPISMNKVLSMIRLLRAYNTAVVLSTQNANDLVSYNGGEYASVLMASCATKIMLHVDDSHAQAVQDLLDLTNNETARIVKFTAGQALIITGSTRMFVKFNPSEIEKLLTFTDDESISKYLDYKKQLDTEEKYKQELENAEDLSNMIVFRKPKKGDIKENVT